MRFLQILCLLTIPSAFAELIRRQMAGAPQLSATDPCSENCSSTYDLLITCAMSEDPTCGCSQYSNISSGCTECLQTTNSSIANGVFDYDYIRSIIAGCSCQIPACQKIGFLVHFCLFTDPLSTACPCPAFVADGTQCSQCLRGVDPYVADLYDTQYVPGCQLFEEYVANITGIQTTCVPGAASSASSSTLPTTPAVSPPSSSVAVFTGNSNTVKYNFKLASLVVLVVAAIT